MSKRKDRYAETIQTLRNDIDILESRLRQTEEAEDAAKRRLALELKYNTELSEHAARPRYILLMFRRKGRMQDAYVVSTELAGYTFEINTQGGEKDIIEVEAREIR